MGFKEMIQNAGRKRKEKKELLRKMLEQDKLETIVQERKKSANQRELERYFREEKEEQIKEQLDYMRKKRRDDIAFNHNPLNIKNITSKTQWEVLKEKNLFGGKGNILKDQKFIHKSDKNLLNSNHGSFFSK